MNIVMERPAALTVGRREWLALLVWLPLAVLLFLNIKCVAVQGHSMQPSYTNGRRVFVWKAVPASTLRVGDVVVFRGADGVEMIKRIALIHQGTVAQVRGTYWTRDGRHLAEPMGLMFSPYLAACDMGLAQLPTADQTLWVVGDNFNDSYDSRDYGPISPRQVLGKVIF